MTMPADDERREVAAKLRELEYADLQESLICAYLDALGIEGYADWVGIAHRLADLIEQTCDRDALLELVKELELGAQCVVGRKWPNMECERMAKHLADDYEMIVCRIRKALGVQDG